jgi:hypothetical protein
MSQVYFESTRMDKIERIKKLKCTHFVDDLEEVFIEESFPSGVKKILYAPGADHSDINGIIIAENWKRIYEHCFS